MHADEPMVRKSTKSNPLRAASLEAPSRLQVRDQERADFRSFFEVVELVGLNPPHRGFQQKLGFAISILEECVERYPYARALLGDLLVATSDASLPK
jgi:hypothetical protein